MELRQLRYIVAIAEAGSLLGASKVLHVAQPALSYQLSSLEREIGAKLFHRLPRGVAATDIGLEVLAHARVVLQDIDRIRAAAHASSAEVQGEVVLGLPTTVALVATLPILSAARAKHPRIRLRIIESHSGFLGEWLQSGRLDVAVLFAGGERSGIVERGLLEERLVFVSPPEGPPEAQRLSLRQVARRPLMLPATGHGLRTIVDKACAELGVALQVLAEVDSLPNIKRAVQEGLASTILSPAAVSEEVRWGLLRMTPIGPPVLKRRVTCATSLSRPLTRAGDAILTLTLEVMRELVRAQVWPATLLEQG